MNFTVEEEDIMDIIKFSLSLINVKSKEKIIKMYTFSLCCDIGLTQGL